ncbi:hypothetical protein KIN20_012475 [Parelaphostrongylus tenuis]|uniref:Uncharacterized protein n=1 Tax=Parelaphostrongylus tenuis TaxID=148309 RepID=A0AAD5QKB5_PARTN|nr:hypothetical protein KIN20_012475 [Parelaphostrongylus tenuis]
MMQAGCIVVGNAVTGICTHKERDAQKCMLPTDRGVTLAPVSGPPLTISGSLSTTNIVMATWSRKMWQSVLNRAVRMLAMAPDGSHFFSATATVGGI